MTTPRTIAIIFIFICTTIAWVILGGSVAWRTGGAQKAGEIALAGDPLTRESGPQEAGPPESGAPEAGPSASGGLWGSEQCQRAPRFYYTGNVFFEPVGADVNAALRLEYRRKGLLWYSTYVTDYHAKYRVKNDDAEPQEVVAEFTFPAKNALYDDFAFRFKDVEVDFPADADSVTAAARLAPGETAEVEVRYKSPGLDRWTYSFGDGVTGVRNFNLTVLTNFDDVDFPAGCISPTAKKKTEEGWRLSWQYKKLVTDRQLGVEMPKKLNPGPIASRISFFAPISLLFFFTVLFVASAVKAGGVAPLHPINFFFLAAAFFAFHLLFAYLADHVDVHLTFLASALVSCALVFIYITLARGIKYALPYATLPQLMFLVLFSYAFFFPGYTGLIIAAGAIVTLAVLMFTTARADWAEKFRVKRS